MLETYSTTQNLTKEMPVLQKGLYDQFESYMFLPENVDRIAEGGLRTQGWFKKSLNDKPLLTVITVVFNGRAYLEETILSVINQTYDNVEYIIIDGASTDGTLDIIKKYEHAIDYWVSEPDRGMYDALNKGFILSTGELMHFCNSDDIFYSSAVISNVVERFTNVNFDCCYGIGVIFDGIKNLTIKYPLQFKLRYLVTLGLPFVQPTFFWKRELLKKVGLFDLNFRVVSDYDLISRLLLDSRKVYRIDQKIIKFRYYGESFGDLNHERAVNEIQQIKLKLREKASISKPDMFFLRFYDRGNQKLYQYYKFFCEKISIKSFFRSDQ